MPVCTCDFCLQRVPRAQPNFMFQHCLHSTKGMDRARPRASKLHCSSYEGNAVSCHCVTSTRTATTMSCIIKQLRRAPELCIHSKFQPFMFGKVSTHCFNMEPDTALTRTANKRYMLVTSDFFSYTHPRVARDYFTSITHSLLTKKKKKSKQVRSHLLHGTMRPLNAPHHPCKKSPRAHLLIAVLLPKCLA